MMKVKNLLTGMLAVLAVLLLTGCQWNENPVRTSLDILQTDLTLQVGESATRAASTESKDYEFIYSSSNPAVAIVDQSGKVTAMSEGTATITVTMPETKIGWYAAATRQYKVIVNKVSAKALEDVDKSTPLTLVAQADGKITVTFNNGIVLKNDIKYTINGGAEQTIAKNTTGAYDIAVKKGDVVQLYSLNTSLGGSAVAGARGTTRAVDTGAKYINIRPSMKTEIYGNVMSLLKGKDNLEGATAIEAKNAFYGLFAGAEKLVNNTERLLVLPATTLTEGCYQDMFNGCKGIEKAPELPAPKLEKNCYQEMFYDCAKLNHVKCLASDITAEGSTKDWLGKAGTEATGEKVLESVVPMTANSDDGVPTSWTAKKIIPVTGIKLDADEMMLKIGDVGTLKATVAPEDASDKTITWTSDKPSIATVDDKGNVTGVAAGTATITAQAGDKTATCVVTVTDAPIAIDLSTLTAEYEAQNGDVLTGTLKENVKISIADGATVTLDGVTIKGVNNSSYKWAGITCKGTANIILKDGSTNTVKGFYEDYPGIQAAVGHTLTIKGTGYLDASSNGCGAGIGGGYEFSCGNIEIKGGTITATGGNKAAGIGSGEQGTCTTITISGGAVTATGGSKAAGIGSGEQGTYTTITISGGTVTANGGEWGAGIGSGYDGASCGDITITSGVTSVTATKGSGADNSIGKGRGGSCGTVTIGGVVGAISTSPYTYPAASLITNPAVGQVIGINGKNYANAAAATADGTTAVAVICYVGDAGTADASSATYKGLALALTDASTGAAWCSQTSNTCLGTQYDNETAAKGDMAGIANTDALVGHATHTHAAASAARGYNSGTHPTGTSAWFLPSAGQWEKMIAAAGNYSALITRASLKLDDNYWSSSELSSYFAWRYDGIYSSGWGQESKDISRYVRACLAF